MSLPVSLIVLFEDRHCLVVAKPARLLTASDRTGDGTLLGLVRAYHAGRQAPGKKGYVAPLHFLDRPVSGVVMYAVSSKASSRMAKALREGRVDKTYVAVVEGHPPAPSGALEDWLVKDRDANVVTVADAAVIGAKPCRLDYRLLARGEGRSFLELMPRTGRSHQIRVQLAARGMPIYGDVKYGAGHDWGGMIALHARRVRFPHPISGVPVTVEAPLPPAWDALWPEGLDV